MTIFEFFVLIFLAVPGAKSALSGQGGNLKSETGNGNGIKPWKSLWKRAEKETRVGKEECKTKVHCFFFKLLLNGASHDTKIGCVRLVWAET